MVSTFISETYVWLIWSSAFLVPWLAAFVGFPQYRRMMLWASLFTAPLGLTEPLFVPEYWNPPSLFDLAQTTGFDIESVIFCFGIGGIGAVLYSLLTGYVPARMGTDDKNHPLHRHHYKALAAPFVVFPVLYFFPWNPIYPGIIAMAVGAIANILCRPDLKRNTWIGGILFLLYYAIFLAGLEWTVPGYIDRVWNLSSLSGFMIFFMPIEELAFAIAFGMYWSGVYEHITWRR
tara:strand:- start:5890 stop:6588 length:699 start_codon:yes stop_codon:yes gene_type:complete